MHIDKVLEFRPKDQSVAATEAAVAKLQAEHVTIQSELDAAIACRGQLLAAGGRKELEENEKRISQTREGIERVEAFLKALEDGLPELRRQEKLAALKLELDGINARQKTEAFATWWKANYAKHATAIAAGLDLEAEAQLAFRKAVAMRQRFEDLGEVFPEQVSPTMLALGGPLRSQTLGELVTLPGPLGAPQIPGKEERIKTKRIVERPIRPTSDPFTPAHLLPMEKIEIEEEETRYSALRDDKPIWPRLPTRHTAG